MRVQRTPAVSEVQRKGPNRTDRPTFSVGAGPLLLMHLKPWQNVSLPREFIVTLTYVRYGFRGRFLAQVT